MRQMQFIVILSLLVSCSHHTEKPAKKDITSNSPVSSPIDAYWENLHNDIKNGGSFEKVLLAADPLLLDQIKKDARDPIVKEVWGQSFNFDSGAKQIILDESLIAELQNYFQIKNDNKIVHAGIMHTYGYLFSILNTPYGFKRKRWTEPTLSYGFGFKDQSISPHPKDGTLLSNISFFAGRVGFSEKKNLNKLSKLKNVSKEVLKFNYQNLVIDVLEEDINYPANFPYLLRTSLVKFNSKLPNEENDYLLIYSFKNKQTNDEQLITAFPIKKDAYLKTLDAQGLGDDRPIIVRYNGFIGGDKELRLSGKRLIFNKKLTKM